MKERPQNVPPEATYDADTNLWRLGSATDPRERLWAGEMLLLDAPRNAEGKLHGEVRWSLSIQNASEFSPRMALKKRLELPDGPRESFTARYENGELQHVDFVLLNTTELSVPLEGGSVHGVVEWVVKPLDGNLFSWKNAKITETFVKIPKPWPHRVKAVFAKGKVVSSEMFDRAGEIVKGPDKPLKAGTWREDATVSSISGYLARGEFAADACAFFPNPPRVKGEAICDEAVARVFALLPSEARVAAEALATAVRSGEMPYLGTTFDLGTFGFGCEENGLYGAEDAKYLGLSSDGSGAMFLLDGETGFVIPYSNEEDNNLEPVFASLDVWAFTMLRVEACAKKLVKKADVKKLFESLNNEAGIKLLSQV